MDCEDFDHGAINEDVQQQWLIASKGKWPLSYVSLHILAHARSLAINKQASLQTVVANEGLLCAIWRTPHSDAQFRCLAWDQFRRATHRGFANVVKLWPTYLIAALGYWAFSTPPQIHEVYAIIALGVRWDKVTQPSNA